MNAAGHTIRFTTSWPELDQALGGGLPLGCIIEIAGTDPEANRTMALRFAAQAQRQDMVVAYVDREQALDLGRARDLGVAVDCMLVSQPDTAMQALEIIETLVCTHVIGLIIVDSIAGFTLDPSAREDFSAVGSIRIMATALRKLASLPAHDCLIVFMSHTPVRKALGPGAIHPPSCIASNGLRYYASVRMQISRASSTANRATVKVLKNKFSTHVFAEVTLRGFHDDVAKLREAVERFADAENFPNLDDAFIEAQAHMLGVEAAELRGLIEVRCSIMSEMFRAAQRDAEEMIVTVGNADEPISVDVTFTARELPMLYVPRSRHKAIGYLPHADGPEGPIEFEATFRNGQWESVRSDEPMRLTTWAHLVDHPDVVLWDKRRTEQPLTGLTSCWACSALSANNPGTRCNEHTVVCEAAR